MKPTVDNLYARILRDIRSRMDEEETLYLELCRAAVSAMVRDPGAACVSSPREIEEQLGQYRASLRRITTDVSRIYRAPLRVYPLTEDASLLDALEAGNAQFEELERIVGQLIEENKVPKTKQTAKAKQKNEELWRSIMNDVDFKREFENRFDEASAFGKRPNILVAGGAGCGKTSLIRTVLGGGLVPEDRIGSGKPRRAGFDCCENESIRLWESRGLEPGGKKDGFSGMMREFVSSCQDDPDIDEHIHLVWYLIRGNSARVTDCDLALMKDLFTFDDLIAVISKKDIATPARLKAVRAELMKAGVPEQHIVEVSDAANGAAGCGELVELSYAMLPADCRDAFMAAQGIDREAKAAKAAEKKARAEAVISESIGKAQAVNGDFTTGEQEKDGVPWNDVKARLTAVLVELLAKLCGLYGLRGREIRESAVEFVDAVLSDAATAALLRGKDGKLDGASSGTLAGALGHFCRNDFEACAAARIRCAPPPGAGFDPGLFRRYLETYRKGMNMKPNILVCGRTGVGKTSLIQAVTRRGVVPDSAIGGGRAATEGFHVYETGAANFIDQEGMAPGTQSVDDCVDLILGGMADRLGTGETGKRIHNVWYCIDGSGARVQETDARLIRTFRKNVLLVVTKSELMRKEQIEAMMKELLELLPREQIAIVSARNRSGLAQLIEKAREMSEESMGAAEQETEAFRDRWKEYYGPMLGEWRKKVSDDADSYINWAAGRAAAIALVPLPLVDVIPLVANETYMIYRLAEVYGIPVDDAVITMILGCTGGSIAGKLAASLLPVLKIPIAAGVTYGVGKAAKAYFESGMKLDMAELRERFLKEEREAKKREWKPVGEDEDPAGNT